MSYKADTQFTYLHKHRKNKKQKKIGNCKKYVAWGRREEKIVLISWKTLGRLKKIGQVKPGKEQEREVKHLNGEKLRS